MGNRALSPAAVLKRKSIFPSSKTFSAPCGKGILKGVIRNLSPVSTSVVLSTRAGAMLSGFQ